MFHPIRHAFAERRRLDVREELKKNGFAKLAEHGFPDRLCASGPLSDAQINDLFHRAGSAIGDEAVIALAPPEMMAALGATGDGSILHNIVQWIKDAIAYLEAHPEVIVKFIIGIMSILAMFGL